MYTKCNITNIINVIEPENLKNKSEWCVLVNYYECYLEKKYKRKYTVDAYLKDATQYIEWYFSNNMECLILNKENLYKYLFYLQNTKNYKKSTITYKKVALRSLST